LSSFCPLWSAMLTRRYVGAETSPMLARIIHREARPLADGLGARLAFRATQSLNTAA
jgi:hypothetical protein